MNKDKGLKIGSWCRCGSNHEVTMLRAAAAHHRMRVQGDDAPNWVLLIDPEGKGIIRAMLAGVDHDELGAPMPVHEFIARMYEQAELNAHAVMSKWVAEAIDAVTAARGASLNQQYMAKILELERQMQFLLKPLGEVEKSTTVRYIKEPDLAAHVKVMPGVSVAEEAGWAFFIDKNRSPKGLSFSIALEYLKNKRTIRREVWPANSYVRLAPKGDALVLSDTTGLTHYAWNPAQCEMLAEDWEVVPEP